MKIKNFNKRIFKITSIVYLLTGTILVILFFLKNRDETTYEFIPDYLKYLGYLYSTPLIWICYFFSGNSSDIVKRLVELLAIFLFIINSFIYGFIIERVIFLIKRIKSSK